jgi:hypothetical protein
LIFGALGLYNLGDTAPSEFAKGGFNGFEWRLYAWNMGSYEKEYRDMQAQAKWDLGDIICPSKKF